MANMFDEVRQNEIHYFKQMGWIEEGTDADAGKHRLTAKGLAEFDRELEAMTSKLKVMTKLKLAANAFTDLDTLF